MKAPSARQAEKPRLRLPLYSKILLWFLVNLLVLALLGFGFLKAQFKLGLDWMLAGDPGDRISAIGDRVTHELSRLPEREWNQRLHELGLTNGVQFALFSSSGAQLFGAPVETPPELRPKLIDRRPAGERPARRAPSPSNPRPRDAPPKPRFMMRAGAPALYFTGIHLDLTPRQPGPPLTLLMVSASLTGGGLFIDLRPWLGLATAALLISALIWMPFVRGMTRFIRSLNAAAGRIASGKFDERITRARADELGELATSVNAMAAQLGDYVAQQRRITADVAHELCSPIARMQMALGVIEQRSTPDQTSYLNKLDNELQHMARLVEEVLAFSKAETLPERESPHTFSLRSLIEQVIAREAPDGAIQIQLSDLQLHSFENALDRAIGNVLRNAVRYAREVEIHGRSETGQVNIQILDRGPGVPEEALPRMFDPFYRPEAARGRHTGGSGLGLAITKRCVEACGGSVLARNREGGGLVIEITVPLVC
jgi:two-component system sensor histidine kinase CpxA